MGVGGVINIGITIKMSRLSASIISLLFWIYASKSNKYVQYQENGLKNVFLYLIRFCKHHERFQAKYRSADRLDRRLEP